MSMRAPVLAAVLALVSALAPSSPRAAEPPADPGYPWTHDVRPVVWCDDDGFGPLLNPLCRASGVTVRYRTALEPFDPARRLEFGERYDPEKYRECRRHAARNDMSCEVHRLRRNELPVHFPYPGVPLPRLPDPPADSGFRPGMSSQEYFEHLCRTEAGEVIYRTVEGVEGVFQMRPRVAVSDMQWRDRFVMPDPYSTAGEDSPGLGLVFLGAGGFRFLETTLYQNSISNYSKRHYHESLFEPPEAKSHYYRYTASGEAKKLTDLMKVDVDSLASEYGYFWRDIRRPMDGVLGIAGGEIVVVQLSNNEVLGIWRGFVRGGDSRRVSWLGGVRCQYRRFDLRDTVSFIQKVLKPKIE